MSDIFVGRAQPHLAGQSRQLDARCDSRRLQPLRLACASRA